ncbi:unnamed protein product [Microthlaspi erraticum]|uniref:F-box domain-containing protein n=1 Tax=Microthlaspi erraticum TaxID=1685480 RepID=A0A6D2IZ07_9BRAS|nr:unnamed protein product [Microthlaspi erraticum]
MEAMTRTMLNLPNELAEEILSRVPLKSIKPVRLTCRKWNDLSKSPSFMKLHLGRLSAAAKEGETQMVAMIGNNTYLASIDVNGDPSTENKGKLNLLNETDEIYQIFHCDGVWLCILQDHSRYLVSNPYLGLKQWIEPRYPHHPHGLKDTFRPFTYALGYENKKGKSCRSVKLLRFLDYYQKQPEEQFVWYEIYDFDSDLWTTLDITPHWRDGFHDLGVSVKGNTYWIAVERNLDAKGVFGDHIVCFDFTSERFGPLLPLPFSVGNNDYATLSSVREEKLAVLLQNNGANPYELDIWITTKIGVQEVSWSKFLKMDTRPDDDMIGQYIQEVPFIEGNFFIDEEKKVAMGFNDGYPVKFVIIGEDGCVTELDLLGEPVGLECTTHLCAYVPSLLQIKGPAEGERKQESKLEKLRYDEKMSRLVAYEERQERRRKNKFRRLFEHLH